MKETGGLVLASTITPVLQANRLTKCDEWLQCYDNDEWLQCNDNDEWLQSNVCRNWNHFYCAEIE